MTDLQQMEARAISAELAIDRLKTYATDTFILWNKDEDSKVGKRLMWMSGTGNAGYEPDLNWVHKPNATAAREMIEKAEQWDTWKTFFDFRFVAKADTAKDMNEVIERNEKRHHREADTLRTRLRESEALVERYRSGLEMITRADHYQPLEDYDGNVEPMWANAVAEAQELLALTPAAALEQLSKEIRASVLAELANLAKPTGGSNADMIAAAALEHYRSEVLEEVAKKAKLKSDKCCHESERFHEDGKPALAHEQTVCARNLNFFAAEIRAMKAPEKGGAR